MEFSPSNLRLCVDRAGRGVYEADTRAVVALSKRDLGAVRAAFNGAKLAIKEEHHEHGDLLTSTLAPGIELLFFQRA